jgi:hypothetical protein
MFGSPLANSLTSHLPDHTQPTGDSMKYGLAWLVGVPPVLIAAWFLFNHC